MSAPTPRHRVVWLRLLELATAGAIAASLAPFAARLSWLFDLTTHFRVQYAIALLPLLVLLLLTRQRAWAGAALAALAINAVALAGYWPAPPAAHAATDRPLRVMTANLLFRSEAGADQLVAIVRGANPDLLLLTEYTPRWATALADLDNVYPYSMKAPRRDAYGLALLSRLPLEGATPLTLESLHAVEARVRTATGRSFTLLGVHLRSPTSRAKAAARNRELDVLAEYRAGIEGPLVVTGDFNITPYSPYLRDWLAETGLRDARRGFGPQKSWPALLPILGIPIDHVAVSDDFVPTAHRRLPGFGSDHYPILAELVLE